MLLWSLSWPYSPLIRSAEPALAVFDSALYLQAVRSALTEINQLNQLIKESAALADLGSLLQTASDAAAIMRDIQEISGRIESRVGGWRSRQFPQSHAGLAEFRRWSNGVCFQASSDAQLAQQLLSRVTDVINRLTQMLDNIGRITGATSGLQSANGALASIAENIAILTGMQAGANESDVCGRMKLLVEESAMEWISQAASSDWGAYTPPTR
jgi:hypothetical protein